MECETNMLAMWILSVISVTILQCDPVQAAETCIFESFEASCNNTEVILMEEALFGRMAAGDCITGDSADLGCYADVLPYMDRRCSGIQECTIPVQPLENVAHGCTKDAYKYLEASYTCIDVQTVASCENVSLAPLSGELGYISSLFWRRTGEGTRQCPWSISAQKGQHIDLYLYDFLLNDFIVQQHGTSLDECPINVMVEEADGLLYEAPLCEMGMLRPFSLYSSATNSISFWIEYNGTIDEDTTFVIQYEVMGCADMPPIDLATMRRSTDTLMIHCNNTQETWYLVCKGTQWLGQLGNCSKKHSGNEHNPAVTTQNPLQQEASVESIVIAVVIGLVVGVVVGLSLLGLVVLVKHCLEKKKKKKEQQLHRSVRSGLAELSKIEVPFPVVQKPNSLKDGARTVPRPTAPHEEPFYHQYDSRTLPTLPRGAGRPYLQRGGSVDDQAVGMEPMKAGTLSTSSSFETVRSEHVYETAYAMQQLHKQYMESLRRQHQADPNGGAGASSSAGVGSGAVAAVGPSLGSSRGGSIPAIPEELTAAQIVALHQAVKDIPHTSQPSDVQAQVHNAQ